MKIISHRGNLDGIKPEYENHPSYINEAIYQNFDVEIDVWCEENLFYLGHDKPQYRISLDWIKERSSNLWCHAKNLQALGNMQKQDINYFWHQEDEYTLTSKGVIWTYPSQKIDINFKQIVLLFDIDERFNETPYGICSDNPIFYKEKFG